MNGKWLAITLLALAAGNVAAQLNFRAGPVEIRQRALKPSDVRVFMDRRDYKNAREIARQCFDQTQDPWCEYYAGLLAYDAKGPASGNEEGLKLVRSAASKEVSSAQVFIGNLHFNGTGVEKNASEALSWWERGARNCNAWAQNALARTYYDGEVVKKDTEAAYYWILLAAYYRFPNADRGVEVVGGELSEPAKKAAQERVSSFVQGSGCGASEGKPVVHDQWSE